MSVCFLPMLAFPTSGLFVLTPAPPRLLDFPREVSSNFVDGGNPGPVPGLPPFLNEASTLNPSR